MTQASLPISLPAVQLNAMFVYNFPRLPIKQRLMFARRGTSVLVSRFLLNIRQVEHSTGDTVTAGMTTLRFQLPASIVGDMGGSLVLEAGTMEDGEEDQDVMVAMQGIELTAWQHA